MDMVTATGIAMAITTAGTTAGVTGDATGIGITAIDKAGMILVYC